VRLLCLRRGVARGLAVGGSSGAAGESRAAWCLLGRPAGTVASPEGSAARSREQRAGAATGFPAWPLGLPARPGNDRPHPAEPRSARSVQGGVLTRQFQLLPEKFRFQRWGRIKSEPCCLPLIAV